MNIAIVCYPTYGGSGVVATELGHYLALKGHKIHFVSYQMPFRLQHRFNENIFYHEVEEVHYPLFNDTLYTLSLSVKLEQIIHLEKLDLIHIHYAIPHAVSAYLAKKMVAPHPIPILTTLHGTDITLVGREPAFKSIVKFGIENSDGVTAVSDWLRRETIEDFQIERPIDVVPNFFDSTRFENARNQANRDHYALQEEKIILHVSNFRPVKRIKDVIKTFKGISDKIPAKLLLIGDGPERSCALELARELDVMNRVWYLGKQDIIEPYFTLADLFLFPSEHESFGLAALEAMACGVPVVSSDGGALPELIEDGVDGGLAEVGDVQTMIEKSLKILDNPTGWKNYSEKAAQKVMEKYQPDPVVQQYENIYTRLISNI